MYTEGSRCLSSTVIPLEIHDYPGIAGLADLDAPLKEYASLVFVIDIQVRPLSFTFSLGAENESRGGSLGSVYTTRTTSSRARDSSVPGEPRNESGGVRTQGGRIVRRVQNW